MQNEIKPKTMPYNGLIDQNSNREKLQTSQTDPGLVEGLMRTRIQITEKKNMRGPTAKSMFSIIQIACTRTLYITRAKKE